MSKSVPALPFGASLFAVNCSTGQWFYVNHANTWQAMPDPILQQLRDNVSQAMSETAPSWGYRISRVLSLIGLNFGSAGDTQWSLLRDAHRQIRWDEEALKAANEDKDWPPLGRRF